MFIYRVIGAFRDKRVEFAVAGGWAVALHGAVRGTVDLDVVVTLTETNMVRAVKALNTIGLESRLPLSAEEIIRFRKEFIQNRNMQAWRFVNPSNQTEIVDILIVEDLRKLKTKSIKVGGKSIPLVAIPDLIRMKKESGRPQDLEDIKALEAIQK